MEARVLDQVWVAKRAQQALQQPNRRRAVGGSFRTSPRATVNTPTLRSISECQRTPHYLRVPGIEISSDRHDPPPSDLSGRPPDCQAANCASLSLTGFRQLSIPFLSHHPPFPPILPLSVILPRRSFIALWNCSCWPYCSAFSQLPSPTRMPSALGRWLRARRSAHDAQR
jgi:hypothetical protein